MCVVLLRAHVLIDADIGQVFVMFFCHFFSYAFHHCFSALSCYNVSLSYRTAGVLPRALDAAREALRIWQRVLPSGHEDISDAEELVRALQQALG